MHQRVISFLLFIGLLLPTATLGQTVRLSPAERRLADSITADQLKDYLYFVASDAMEGRDTPSRGLDTVAEFLKMQLTRWRFKPAGDDGTFFQKIAVRIESPDSSNTLLSVDGKQFAFGEDFFRVGGTGSANALMVFAGNGWVVKSRNLDPYADTDIRGKILVLYTDAFLNRSTLIARPAGVAAADLSGTKGVDWSDPLTYAEKNGAVGILVVALPQLQGRWDQVRQFYSRGSAFPEKLRDAPAPGTNQPPVMLVSGKVGEAIFEGTSVEPATATTAAAINKTVSMTAVNKTETKWTQNVVALWEGGDPILKNEMVAVGAHYDHIGTNPNLPGDDRINNGADDDGSGTVAALSMAEALARSKVRPKRSILFVWHCGEEKGLWGSEFFNKFPTVDIQKVITQLNIDMIGRSLDPNNVIKCDRPSKPCNEELSRAGEIYVIGSEMMSSTLGSITKGTNEAYLKLGYNYRYDDPKDPNRFFFRSDHFNYAQNGVPIVFWFDGVHEDYHRPSDSPDKIDYMKMQKVARTIFLTMWELSALPRRPKIDKQLPAELKMR